MSKPKFTLDMQFGACGVETVRPGYVRSWSQIDGQPRIYTDPAHYYCLGFNGKCMHCGKIFDQAEWDSSQKKWWEFWK